MADIFRFYNGQNPNTTGTPYHKGKKEMRMEIIKQMYDIGCLCDKVDNPNIVSEVFASFAETELLYRENQNSIKDVSGNGNRVAIITKVLNR